MSLRKRSGFTLLEVAVTIVIASIALYGFGILLYDTGEQMHIDAQIRNAEEFGNYYINEFAEKIRNGTQVPNTVYESIVTKMTTPSEAEIYYIDPTDRLLESKVYEFEYSVSAGLPIIRINDDIVDYPYYPPPGMDSRDEINVPSSSFYITEFVDEEQEFTNISTAVKEKMFKNHIELSFDIVYRRYNKKGNGYYEKVLHFSTAAYANNSNWPVLKEGEEVFEDVD